VELSLYTDETGFDALKAEWNDLLRRSRFDTLFLTWEWQTTWWHYLGKQRGPLYILAAREGERTVGILPLYATAETTESGAEPILHVVGCIEVSDYLDFIIEDGREEEVYAAFLAWLASPAAPRWTALDLCNQPGPSLAHTRLAEMAQAAGYKVTVAQEDVCPIIDLPAAAGCADEGAEAAGREEAWEQYLGTLDKKERHEIRRKLRRIERDAPGANVRFAGGGQDLPEDVDAFIALHRNSRADKHAFMTDEMQAYFRAIAQVLAEHGWLQLSFLDIDGQPVASYFCFDYNDEILVYNSGYDPGAVPQLSPGWVLLAQVIQHAIGLCRSKFDFLQGDEDYKHRFGGIDTPVYRTFIERG
jgi:CelD/BcsL family acetyltransferase involved in cellulose biosynthesis